VICDDRMQDRVQVILVLTGIGATSVDSKTVQNSETKPAPQTVQAPAEKEPVMLHPFQNSESQQFEIAGNSTDLDVPAFMRRRVN
jgi:hypothetical protein